MLASHRSPTVSWTALALAFLLVWIASACRCPRGGPSNCGQSCVIRIECCGDSAAAVPDEPSTHPATARDGLPPIVRGRARWVTPNSLAEFDIWMQEQQSPAEIRRMDVSWNETGPVNTYPGGPQRTFTRRITAYTPVDWIEYAITASKAWIEIPAKPKLDVQIILTTRSNAQFSYHLLLPVNSESADWYIFGS